MPNDETPPVDVPAPLPAAVEIADLPPAPPAPAMIPKPSEWVQIMDMAQSLARSSLVRPAYRGQPDNIALLALYGRDLNLPLTTALTKIHVIEGVPTLSAEAQGAVIRRAGHDFWGEVVYDEKSGFPIEARIVGKRDGREYPTRYRIAEAIAQGMCVADPSCANGVRARTSNGKPKPWESSTEDMLWARCLSRLARRAFADVLAGITYTPDDMGYVIDEGEETERQPAEPDQAVVDGWESRQDRVDRHKLLSERIRPLPEELRAGLREKVGWPILNRELFERVEAAVQEFAVNGAIDPAVFGERMADAEVVDAEVVDEPANTPPAPPPAADGPPAAPDGLCGDCGALLPSHADGCPQEPF